MSRKRKANIPLDLSDFLALQGPGSLAMEISPGVTIHVDSIALNSRKAELKEYCRGIPPEEYVTWRGLLPRMQGNEMLSKLLVALGDHIGAWVRHPPASMPFLWGPDHPMVLIGSAMPAPRSVPKPSAGDLEAGTVTCPECSLQMGKFGSKIHDYVEAEPGAKCISYDREDCEMLEIEKTTAATRRIPASPEMPEIEVPEPPKIGEAPDWAQNYMNSLNDE